MSNYDGDDKEISLEVIIKKFEKCIDNPYTLNPEKFPTELQELYIALSKTSYADEHEMCFIYKYLRIILKHQQDGDLRSKRCKIPIESYQYISIGLECLLKIDNRYKANDFHHYDEDIHFYHYEGIHFYHDEVIHCNHKWPCAPLWHLNIGIFN